MRWLPVGWGIITNNLDGSWMFTAKAAGIPEGTGRGFRTEREAMRAAKRALRLEALDMAQDVFTQRLMHLGIPGTHTAFCGAAVGAPDKGQTRRCKKCEKILYDLHQV